MKYFYKRIVLILVVTLLAVINVHAQRKHFMYVQSENKEPFYISINNKHYSSTMSGYLIIPRLKNGKYFFVAGFPKNKYTEQNFSYVINDKDVGFIFKQFGNEGWGLFNLIDFSKTMANDANWEKDKMQNDTITLDDTYTINPIHKTEEKPTTSTTTTTTTKETTQPTKTDSTKTTVTDTKKNDDETVTTTTQKTTEETKPTTTTKTNTQTQEQEQKENTKTTSTTATNNQQRKGIIKTFQKITVNGIDETYIDYTTTPNDTIIVFIPTSNTQTTAQQNNSSDETEIVYTKYNKTGQYNTSCVNLATATDVSRVRKLMSAQTSDDKMIKIAKTAIGNKCYYVEQVQKLGLLFLSEQSRLKFFTTCYDAIYDRYNYPSLEMQFTLSSVINQFRQSLY
jgi:hypothetical protein